MQILLFLGTGMNILHWDLFYPVASFLKKIFHSGFLHDVYVYY